MIEKYTLNDLNQDSVVVFKQTHIEYNGEYYPIGDLWTRAYSNSTKDRERIKVDLPLAQQNAILAVWGDTPTIEENSDI